MVTVSMKRLCVLFLAIVALSCWFPVIVIGDSVDVVSNIGSVLCDGRLCVDTSGMSDGYVHVWLSDMRDCRERLTVLYNNGDEILNYWLYQDNDYDVIPLQFGSGDYCFKVFRWNNNSGFKSRSFETLCVSLSVTLTDERASWLVPNQYINYTEDMDAYVFGNELCDGLITDRDKYDAIENYISQFYSYDEDKAREIMVSNRGFGSDIIYPDIEGCYSKHKGICQDLSALMICLLRSQNIHSVMDVGWMNDQYHAWVRIFLDGEEFIFDPTVAVNGLQQDFGSYKLERFY